MCRIPASSSLRNRKLPIVSFIVFALPRPVGPHGGWCCCEHKRSPGSMLSSTYRSSPASGRPLGGFLPLELALDFLLHLGSQSGFENLPTEAVQRRCVIVPPL